MKKDYYLSVFFIFLVWLEKTIPLKKYYSTLLAFTVERFFEYFRTSIVLSHNHDSFEMSLIIIIWKCHEYLKNDFEFVNIIAFLLILAFSNITVFSQNISNICLNDILQLGKYIQWTSFLKVTVANVCTISIRPKSKNNYVQTHFINYYHMTPNLVTRMTLVVQQTHHCVNVLLVFLWHSGFHFSRW